MKNNLKKYKFLILIQLILIEQSFSTITPAKTKAKVKELKLKSGPVDESVFDRELVQEEPAARDILVESGAYYRKTDVRNFTETVLGYVTPWNNHGYNVAKIWSKKFDIISPVWLQINRNGENSYTIAGTHDVDNNWIQELRKNYDKTSSRQLQIFPRIIFDKFSENDFSKLLTFKSERDALNSAVIRTCRKYKFDGIVLEIWTQLSRRIDDDFLYNLVIDMANSLKENSFQLILVIPPLRDEMKDLFSAKHFEKLYPHVYAFSLMTYDFSTVQRPGANAPLHWMRTAVENIVPKSVPNYALKRKKLLMGLNFYGNDYTPDGGGPIVGNQFLDLVKHVKKRLVYDEHDVENFFEVKLIDGRHIVFYPTLFSINERINLAKELGVGISIWELGQGLDYFYDLF